MTEGWGASCITPSDSASTTGRMEWPSPVNRRAVARADFANKDQEFRFRSMNLRYLFGDLCGDAKSAGIPEMSMSWICKSESLQFIDGI